MENIFATEKIKIPLKSPIYLCTNRSTPESGLVFYRIPKRNVKQRELLKAIKRENWFGNKLLSAKQCSTHFISGKFCG